MKQHITLVAVILGIIVGVQSLPANDVNLRQTKWAIPQRNGSIRWMTEAEVTAEASLEEFKSNQTFNKVKFFLYTEANPTNPVEISLDNPGSLARSHFNSQNPTRFMIHGWNGGYTASWSVREALLLSGTDRKYNFIAVDWSVYAKSTFYITSQKSCSKAGKIVAEFIDWMHDSAKLSFETLAVYGISLGAHVAGFTGKNVKRGKIQSIVGLDPALPLYQFNNPEGRLADTDAVYVETIQTSGGSFGFYNPIGKASFYPNGGQHQPGCENDIFCSHVRSVEYFAEALRLEKKNAFRAVACSDLESIEKGTCDKRVSRVRLGDPNNIGRAKGIYYLETNSKSPYSEKKF